jgi:glucose/arabinose dehydrogenase
MRSNIPVTVVIAAMLSACGGSPGSMSVGTEANAATAAKPFDATAMGTFDEPWAMTFLNDRQLLVTEKKGVLKLVTLGGTIGEISGVPKVSYGGQGGLGDVVLHPQFASNKLVYLSYAEAAEDGDRGAAVARGKLTLDDKGRRGVVRCHRDLAPGAESFGPGTLRPPHRLRSGWSLVDQLGRAPEVRSRAGHAGEPRQDRAPQ